MRYHSPLMANLAHQHPESSLPVDHATSETRVNSSNMQQRKLSGANRVSTVQEPLPERAHHPTGGGRTSSATRVSPTGRSDSARRRSSTDRPARRHHSQSISDVQLPFGLVPALVEPCAERLLRDLARRLERRSQSSSVVPKLPEGTDSASTAPIRAKLRARRCKVSFQLSNSRWGTTHRSSPRVAILLHLHASSYS